MIRVVIAILVLVAAASQPLAAQQNVVVVPADACRPPDSATALLEIQRQSHLESEQEDGRKGVTIWFSRARRRGHTGQWTGARSEDAVVSRAF
jgi:hypothetical protein